MPDRPSLTAASTDPPAADMIDREIPTRETRELRRARHPQASRPRAAGPGVVRPRGAPGPRGGRGRDVLAPLARLRLGLLPEAGGRPPSPDGAPARGRPALGLLRRGVRRTPRPAAPPG